MLAARPIKVEAYKKPLDCTWPEQQEILNCVTVALRIKSCWAFFVVVQHLGMWCNGLKAVRFWFCLNPRHLNGGCG
jgi:hypothetical protein